MPTAEQQATADRLRALLPGEPEVREKMMFGVHAFLVDDRLVVCAKKDGGLLIRVSPDDHEVLVLRPGAHQAEMGPSRSMGSGWLEVDADAIAEDDALLDWVDTALAFHRASG